MTRHLSDLRIHWYNNEPWFEARQLCELFQQLDTRKITRHVVNGHKRRVILRSNALWADKIITLLDSTALVEAWIALTKANPVSEARQYLATLKATA